jgi:hypothetical protein
MNEFKVGEWVHDTTTNETFVILKIDDYCLSMTTYTDEGYFDIYYEAHAKHLCCKATQEQIEAEAVKMLELNIC